MKNYLKLLKFLSKYKKMFGIAVVVMFVSRIFEGFQMSLIVPVMDRIFTKKPIIPPDDVPQSLKEAITWINSINPETMFLALPVVVVAVIILKNMIIYIYSFLMNDISQRIMRDVRFQLYAKIQSLSLDYFSKKRTGELLSRITNDVQIVENAVSYSITDMFVQTFTIVMYVGIAFTIHRKAAFLIFFVFPFIIWPISLIGKKLRKLSRSTQERVADINTILLETISGIRVVKAFCTEAFEIERFRAKNHDFYKLRMKAVRRTLLIAPITEIFSVAFGVLIIFWLGRQVMDEKLSAGIFFLFFASIMSIISPLKKLGNVHAMVQQALAANERIYDVLDKEPTVQEKPDAVHLATIRTGIELKNVFFRYDDESELVLKDINLSIKVGELVAIVGPTGTGKSTLANLIPRFYDPVEGAVTFDGVNLKDVSFLSLRQQIGIVAQETFLFNDTVRNNITYGTPNASQADIETAARGAYAHRFIVEMPQAYETVVGDRGFRLSGGEKQRVAIARAVLRNPPILILDEATSQLDSESEKFVQEALDQLMKGRTVIAIAHRLSTIKKAHKIVVLNQGQIVGLGTNDELLKTCDLYKRLYETQFQV